MQTDSKETNIATKRQQNIHNGHKKIWNEHKETQKKTTKTPDKDGEGPQRQTK